MVMSDAEIDAYLAEMRNWPTRPTDYGPQTDRIIRGVLKGEIAVGEKPSRRRPGRPKDRGPLVTGMDLSTGFNVARPVGRGCAWPLWSDAAPPDHRYCGKPRVPGRSWCRQHCERGYTR